MTGRRRPTAPSQPTTSTAHSPPMPLPPASSSSAGPTASTTCSCYLLAEPSVACPTSYPTPTVIQRLADGCLTVSPPLGPPPATASASSTWRMAPSPLPASSACQTADGTHAVQANCRPPSRLRRANCRPRPRPPAPAGWRPRPCLRRADCRPPAAASLQTRTPFPTPAPSPQTIDAITFVILLFFLRSVDILFFLCAAAATPSLLLPRVFYYWLMCWLGLHFRL